MPAESDFFYHVSNKCYKNYTNANLLRRIQKGGKSQKNTAILIRNLQSTWGCDSFWRCCTCTFTCKSCRCAKYWLLDELHHLWQEVIQTWLHKISYIRVESCYFTFRSSKLLPGWHFLSNLWPPGWACSFWSWLVLSQTFYDIIPPKVRACFTFNWRTTEAELKV